MKNFINPDDISLLAREVFVDDKKAELAIREAEYMDIKSVLGDALFDYIKTHEGECRLLLDGGTVATRCGMLVFGGLKRAVAYFAYSRLVVAGNVEVTRSGIRSRDSNFSHTAERDERQQVSRECNAIAAKIMNDTITYINNCSTLMAYLPNGGLRPLGKARTECKIIGG